jgi:hypothetical protein
MDDLFGRNTDAVGLKWLARLLMGVAKKVYWERDQLSATAPRGATDALR